MLRQEMIRLAHKVPELRVHLLPLIKQAKSFEDAVKGKTFRNPETGNKVLFDSLPSEEQKRIRSQWVKKNPSGEKSNPKELLKEDPNKYVAEHVSENITKSSLADALKDTDWVPRWTESGKGEFNARRKVVEFSIDNRRTKEPPVTIAFGGDKDGDGIVMVEALDETFKLSGNPKADAKKMQQLVKELIGNY